ncbi:Na+/H+ antiporter subunit E [Microbulbifer sp.]|uniref:Na+/H+ antiporter subunit E n=1 Tax=Microbulbifer sp. TaxID=1908541 RepID=UPI003F303824
MRLFALHLLACFVLARVLELGTGGVALAFVALYVLCRLLGFGVSRLRRYARALERGAVFCPWFAFQVFRASLHVARLVLAQPVRVAPAVIAHPVRGRGRGSVTLLGLLLTLTPGTLALEYDEAAGLLYIHALDARCGERVQHLVTELERRLLAWIEADGEEEENP